MEGIICRGAVKAAAIVSNHCSWLDILVHMSKYFPAFVARDSTKDLTMIGLIRQAQLKLDSQIVILAEERLALGRLLFAELM